MHENEVPGMEYAAAKPTFTSFFKKLAIRLHLINQKPATAKVNAATGIVGPAVDKLSTDKHGEIISLLNKGKNYDDAERIVEVTKEYKIDLEQLDADKVKVTGKSVWINLED